MLAFRVPLAAARRAILRRHEVSRAARLYNLSRSIQGQFRSDRLAKYSRFDHPSLRTRLATSLRLGVRKYLPTAPRPAWHTTSEMFWQFYFVACGCPPYSDR